MSGNSALAWSYWVVLKGHFYNILLYDCNGCYNLICNYSAY